MRRLCIRRFTCRLVVMHVTIRMWGAACEQTGQVDVYNTASSLFVESVDSFRVGRMRVVSDRVLFDLSTTASGTLQIELVFGI